MVRGYPILGLLPRLLRDPLGLLLDVAREHPGAVVRLDLGLGGIYMVSSPEHLEQIWQSGWRDFIKGESWDGARRVLGDSLVTKDGASWLRSRRLLQPPFAEPHLRDLAPLMTESIAASLDHLARLGAGGAPVDLEAAMERLAQGAFLRSMFGVSLDREEEARVCEAISDGMGLAYLRLVLPRWCRRALEPALRRVDRVIDETILRVVRARRREGIARGDLLDLLLQARDEGGDMTDSQLRDELVTMLVGAVDPTTGALTWILYLLDQHPEVDRRLRAEVAEVLDGRRPTAGDLGRLPYTTMVISEGLRLYPPGWLIPRAVPEHVNVGDWFVPAGSILFLSPFVTHRDPRIWGRPWAFDPERFSPERAVGRPCFAFTPFGGGPRQCLGKHFALMEMKFALAMAVQKLRFRLATRRPIAPKASLVLKTRRGLPMTVTPA